MYGYQEADTKKLITELYARDALDRLGCELYASEQLGSFIHSTPVALTVEDDGFHLRKYVLLEIKILNIDIKNVCQLKRLG